MSKQGTYPIGVRTLTGTDTATGVVTGATADIPLSTLATYVLTSLTLSYADTGLLASLSGTVNSYVQAVIQNKSNGAAASANYNVSNDQATATTNYGEFGINSSGFTGTGAFNQPGYVYLASGSTDLAIGTYGLKAIHFLANNSATDAFTVNADNTVTMNTVNSVNGGQLAGLRNRIINGDMRVAQRGSSGNANGFTVDRWYVPISGTNLTFSQSLFGVVGSIQSNNVLVINGAASNTGLNIIQRVESMNCRDLAGQTVTLSGYIYQTTGSTISLVNQLYYPASTDTFGASYTSIGTISTTSVPNGAWTKFVGSITVPAAGITGLELRLWANNTPLVAGQQIFLTQVQLELGSVATTFEQRPIGLELSLCQRYYQVIYGGQLTGQASGANFLICSANLPVPLRTNASILTLLKTSYAAASFELMVGGNWVSNAAATLSAPSAYAQNFISTFAGFTGLSLGQTATFNLVSTPIVGVSAEL